MLLLVLAALWVLVTEDEVDLVGSATLVWTEHDNVRRCVGEFGVCECLVLLEELHVCSTALKTALKLDLILDDESLTLVRDGLWELGRDGVVGCLVLENKTLVTFNALEHTWLLDVPGTNVLPLLFSVLFLGV